MSSDFNKGKTRDEKIDTFLDALSWYFSEKTTPTGFYHKIGQIEEKLGQLIGVAEKFNNNIEEAGMSSERLTLALNRITLVGVIIAGVGLVIALGNLLFEVYKYFN
jgi:hypothetical protein